MSTLLDQAKRQEREQFFRRLDYQWGKGLRQKTKSDRCPDFRIVTRPPAMHCFTVQWRATSHSDWQAVYSSEWRKQCDAYLAAYMLLYPTLKLRVQDITPRSKQVGVTDIPRTHEDRLHCQAQTLVPAPQVKPVSKVLHATALGPFSDAPSPSSLVADTSFPTEPLPPVQGQGVKPIVKSVVAVESAKPEPRFCLWPSRVPVY